MTTAGTMEERLVRERADRDTATTRLDRTRTHGGTVRLDDDEDDDPDDIAALREREMDYDPEVDQTGVGESTVPSTGFITSGWIRDTLDMRDPATSMKIFQVPDKRFRIPSFTQGKQMKIETERRLDYHFVRGGCLGRGVRAFARS